MAELIQADVEDRLILWVFPAVLSSSSNGHRSMAYLIGMLVQRGYPCGVLVPSISRFKKLSTLQLPNGVCLIKNERHPQSSLCVVAPDTADPYFIETLRSYGHRVLWWLMAPPALLGSPFPKIQAKDSVAIYSSFVLPGLSDYCFVQDPSCFQEALDQRYKQCSDAPLKVGPRRPRIGVYCGKARLTILSPGLENFLRKAEVVPFSRYWPSSRQDYSELVNSLDGLICFDPLTAVILDVVAQGKPVFLPNNPFPSSAYAGYPLKCLHFAYADELKFLRHLQGGPSSLGSIVPAMCHDIQLANEKGCRVFVEIVEKLNSDSSKSSDALAVGVKLQSYVQRLEVLSTIQPCLDGEAVSAHFLLIYLWILSFPLPIRVLMRRPLLLLLSGSDRLARHEVGRCVLRLTIYLPSALRSLPARLCWIGLSIYQKWLLPAIGRAFVS